MKNHQKTQAEIKAAIRQIIQQVDVLISEQNKSQKTIQKIVYTSPKIQKIKPTEQQFHPMNQLNTAQDATDNPLNKYDKISKINKVESKDYMYPPIEEEKKNDGILALILAFGIIIFSILSYLFE